jgi:hypothetical protein
LRSLAQTPHESVPPQPSDAGPHIKSSSAQVLGTQLLQTLSTQISPSAQMPQLTRAPVHELLTIPQFLPRCRHSVGSGVGRQVLPMQVSVDRQPLPQVKVPPQPFEMGPHSAPAASQVVSAHGVQVLLTASQTSPGSQLGQSTVPPQPSAIWPHFPLHDFLTQSWHWPVAPLQVCPA